MKPTRSPRQSGPLAKPPPERGPVGRAQTGRGSGRCGGARAAPGFTLLELMIAVVVVAILAAVAYPSYQDFIRRGNRSDAHALLQSAQLAQERHRLGHTSYADTTAALAPACPASGDCLSQKGHYRLLAPSAVSGSTYTLTAEPVSALQRADRCGSITLGVSGGRMSYGPADKPECWSR